MSAAPAARRIEHLSEDVTLYLGDCRAILPDLGPVDAVVTDPPYGIGRDGRRKSSSKHGGHKGYAFKGWDSSTPAADLLARLARWPGGSIMWGANYYPEAILPSAGWLVWDKGQRIDQADAELAFSSRPGALRIFTANRACLAFDGAEHPTQKPVKLMRWCLGFLPKARTILDPFMGSGATGVACVQLGRRFVGIEIDETYFDIACRRIADELARPRLALEPPATQPAQEAMSFDEAG